jgi:hypothetical protein
VEFFFEDQQRRGLGQRLLLARQLSLELADPVRNRLGRAALLIEGETPLLKLGQTQPVMLQVRRKLFAVELARFGEDSNLVVD